MIKGSTKYPEHITIINIYEPNKSLKNNESQTIRTERKCIQIHNNS